MAGPTPDLIAVAQNALKIGMGTVATALEEWHRVTIGAAPAATTADAWLAALKMRESGGAAPLDTASLSWKSLRQIVVEAQPSNTWARLSIPHAEYEAVAALDRSGHTFRKADPGLIAVAREVATKPSPYGSTAGTAGPQAPAAATRWWTSEEVRQSGVALGPALADYDPPLLLHALQTCVQNDSRKFNAEPERECARLEASALGKASGLGSQQTTTVLNATRRVLYDRNGLFHLHGSLDDVKVTRLRAFDIIMRVITLVYVLQQSTQSDNVRRQSEKDKAALMSLAEGLAHSVPPPATTVAPMTTFFDAVGLNAEVPPLLVLVAPSGAHSVFARLPLHMVLDTYTPANLPLPAGAFGPLWASFQQTATENSCRVQLRNNLRFGLQGSRDFERAVTGNYTGVLWVQPGAPHGDGHRNAVVPAWDGDNPAALLAGQQGLSLARNAAQRMLNIAKSKHLRITVIILRLGTYAHVGPIRASAGAGSDPVPIGPDGRPDVGFSRIAAAFLTRLLENYDTPARVLVITDSPDLVAGPDPWLSTSLRGINYQADRVYLPEFFLEYKLRITTEDSELTTGGVYLKQGGDDVPLVELAALNRQVSVADGDSREPLWAESAGHARVLRNAGMQLVHKNLAATILEEMERDPTLQPHRASLEKKSASSTFTNIAANLPVVSRLAAMLFAMGRTNPWPVICEGALKLLGVPVVVHRVNALASLHQELNDRVLRSPSPLHLFTIVLEHELRTGGTVVLMQFAWQCYQTGHAVLWIQEDAVQKFTDKATVQAAAKAAHLAASVASRETATRDTASAKLGPSPPLLILCVDRFVSEHDIENVILAELRLQPMRIVVVRTRAVDVDPSAPSSSVHPVRRSDTSIVRLGKISDAEWSELHRCHLNVASVLFPSESMDSLDEILQGLRAPLGTERVFRRLYGMLIFSRLHASGEKVAKLANASMQSWIHSTLQQLYESAESNPSVRPTLHALLYVALVQWCNGPKLQITSLSSILTDSNEQLWLYQLLPEAEAYVRAAALENVVEKLKETGGGTNELDGVAALLVYFPEVLDTVVGKTESSPLRSFVGRELYELQGKLISACRKRVVVPEQQPLISDDEVLLGTDVVIRMLGSLKVSRASDFWTEAIIFEQPGLISFLSHEVVELFLSAALRFEAQRWPASPEIVGMAGGPASTLSVPPEGVYTVIACLLRGVLRMPDFASLRNQVVRDVPHNAGEPKGTLAWESYLVFARPEISSSRTLRRHTFSTAIDLLLQYVAVDSTGSSKSGENFLKSFATKAIGLAAAVFFGVWNMSATTARLMLTFLDRYNDRADHKRPDFLATLATLHAAATGHLAVALSVLGHDAIRRRAYTFDMIGNSYRYLLGTGLLDKRISDIHQLATTSANDSAKQAAFDEIADMLVRCNRARQWYSASRQTRLSGSPFADNAELWVQFLEQVAKIRKELMAQGCIGESRDPYVLAKDTDLASVTKLAVASSDMLKEAVSSSQGTMFTLGLTTTMDAAVVEAHDSLRQLLVAIRQDVDSPEENVKQMNIERHEKLFARWVRVCCDGSAADAFDLLRSQVDRLALNNEKDRLPSAARQCALMADTMWTFESSVRTTLGRFRKLSGRSSDARFVLEVCLLPHIQAWQYDIGMVELSVELAAVASDGEESAAKTLAVARGAYEYHVRSNIGIGAAEGARLLYALCLFCQLYHSASPATLSRELKMFHHLNGQFDSISGTWRKPAAGAHDFANLHQFRLVRPRELPAHGAWVLNVRRRFSEADEAEIESKRQGGMIVSERVYGEVISLKYDVRGHVYCEGVLKLNNCDVQLSFSIAKTDPQVTRDRMPYKNGLACAYIDAVSAKGYAGTSLMAVHVQALKHQETGESFESSLLTLADYLSASGRVLHRPPSPEIDLAPRQHATLKTPSTVPVTASVAGGLAAAVQQGRSRDGTVPASAPPVRPTSTPMSYAAKAAAAPQRPSGSRPPMVSASRPPPPAPASQTGMQQTPSGSRPLPLQTGQSESAPPLLAEPRLPTDAGLAGQPNQTRPPPSASFQKSVRQSGK